MNPSVICYPQGQKAKSWRVLEAFAQGCSGEVYAGTCSPVLVPGAAAFFGVVGLEHLLRLAVAERRDFYYGDNAYFDVARDMYYRFSKNCIQPSGLLCPDVARMKSLGVQVRPWKKDGRHIVIVEQSEHFLNLVGQKNWLFRVLYILSSNTDRPVKVRKWSRDKLRATASLKADLEDAWCLVTHMSAAANEALLSGVPVFVSGQCAASPLASGELANIEKPVYPENREEWAAGLAAYQWTIDELKNGTAWRALQK